MTTSEEDSPSKYKDRGWTEKVIGGKLLMKLSEFEQISQKVEFLKAYILCLELCYSR
jgi:hypothetical protein